MNPSNENSNILNEEKNKIVISNGTLKQNPFIKKALFKHLFQSELNNDQPKEDDDFTKLFRSTIESNNKSILEGKSNILDKVMNKYGITQTDKNLENIKEIKLTIDNNFNLLNEIGNRLPNLEILNLSKSNINSLNLLGISFNKLRILNVSECGLVDLSGIICFENLNELYADKNKIRDLVDLEMCNELKIINLNGNFIEDMDNLYYLASCSKLEVIYLSGNPISHKLLEENKGLEFFNKNIKLILE